MYVGGIVYLVPMFIRETKKQRSKDSKIFYQYSLVQSTRINGKARQRSILYLGSDTELRDKENRAMVLDVLKNKIMGRKPLLSQIPQPLYDLALLYYNKYQLKYDGVEDTTTIGPPSQREAIYEAVDVSSVEVNQVSSFGPEHLCLQTLEKLQLSRFLRSLGIGEKDIRKSLISIAARAIYTSTEHKTAQILEMNSSLTECLRHSDPITHKQLYNTADLLYNYRKHIDDYLYKRVTDMFDLDDKIVIFDISNTYFESRKQDSDIATYGRSKEKRYDCPIVVFTGVINKEGFIRHSRTYEGNKPDKNTLSDMIDDMERNAPGDKSKTVVLDAGIADEENLKMLTEKGYKYVCVSRTRLKDYPSECLDTQITRETEKGKREVKLSVFTPKDNPDTWMLVQSEAKQLKEQSMRAKLRARFEEALSTAEAALHKKGGTKKIEKVWERIGRYRQKHRHVSSAYDISITEKKGNATSIKWTIKNNKIKEDKSNGIYFIRTNYKNPEEKELWDIYNTIREVESTFRCLKTDLNIRPVHHQNDERSESHIYLTLLAYQLVNTIKYMLKKSEIKHDWRNIVRIMSTHTLQTIKLTTETKTIHLRKPAKPIKEVQDIYKATNCKNTQKTMKKYVVYH